LANVFLERCLELVLSPSPSGRGARGEGCGVVQIVMPQNWLAQSVYRLMRIKILNDSAMLLMAKLGARAFETISGEVVNVILFTASAKGRNSTKNINMFDVSSLMSIGCKRDALITEKILSRNGFQFLKDGDALITFGSTSEFPSLNQFAESYQGIKSGDDGCHCRQFWEVNCLDLVWKFELGTTREIIEYGGREKVINWGNKVHLARLQGQGGWGRNGIIVNQMGALFATLHAGELFDGTVTCLVPKDTNTLAAIWAYCSSASYAANVRTIETGVAVSNAILAKVQFDICYWQQVAAERYPNGLPKPYSDDPTQWIFHGHPQPATDPLQVAVARLLCYVWPAETDDTMELSNESHTWIARCKPLVKHVDDDGIVCLPAVRGEQPAHDRLLALLIDAWETVTPGSWTPSVLDKLLAQADCAGKGLAVWLRDYFFEQHAKRFHHRPFIWHVWDGQKDGFSALVNYHLLNGKNMERLIHTYLGDWIRTQEAGVANGIDGAALRLSAAKNLSARLQAILEGEKPYDIFVRWKPLAEQPIGWNPDPNDGIRLNIRPFMTAEVLRHNKKPKLNITWDKDRGKDVESAPWFAVFGGDRINDHHLTLKEKAQKLSGAEVC